mgnify:CR=1 FL=1
MKLLLLTGIQEELYPMIPEFRLVFSKETGIYQSANYPELFAATTGPGVKKRKELREIFKTIIPDIIVNAGLIGTLTDDPLPAPGDLAKISSVVEFETHLVFPVQPHGGTLLTVRKPVFEPREKWLLSRDYQARFCDMEASRILQLLREVDEVREDTSVVFCKVVGDTPAQYDLYQHEELVRGWHRENWFGKMRIGLKFPGGPMRLRRLLALKEKSLDGLTEHTRRTVKALLAGANPDKMGAVYAPA